jgi:hypothetical protein
MPDARKDLRATAEAIQDDALLLADLEARKLSLDPADPEVERLSVAVQQLVQKMSDKAAAELELAAEIGDAKGE